MRWIAALLAACIALLSAQAQTVRTDGATVVVNEMTVLTLRTSLASLTPTERAARIAENIRRAPAGGAVTLEIAGTTVVVRVGETVIVRVSPEEARAANQSALALARRWGDNLTAALALPGVRLTQPSVQIPVGGSAEVRVVGSAVRFAAIATTGPEFATARLEQGLLHVTGVARGRAFITVQAGESSSVLEVRVLPFAARLTDTLSATVLGTPANAHTVRQAATAAIQAQLPVETGARVRVLDVAASSIAGDSTRTIRARVSVTAPEAFPVTGEVAINVRNLGHARIQETELWYCNYPETVRQPGNLFYAPIQAGTSARLLYHHVNETKRPLTIAVVATNPSDQPAQLAVTAGDGIPHRDPVIVGLDAAFNFLRDWLTGSSIVMTIPPRTSLPIALRNTPLGTTASGLTTLRLLEGGPEQVFVRTDAIETPRLGPRWVAAATNSMPWTMADPRPLNGEPEPTVVRDHVYPQPFRKLVAEYAVGGRFTHIRIGQAPIPNAAESRNLQGNFGVIYEVTAILTNPSSVERDVDLIFEASAGYSSALFAFGQEVKRLQPMLPKREGLVKRVRLSPGGRREVKFLTIPLSGSSYPSTIIVRPAGS